MSQSELGGPVLLRESTYVLEIESAWTQDEPKEWAFHQRVDEDMTVNRALEYVEAKNKALVHMEFRLVGTRVNSVKELIL